MLPRSGTAAWAYLEPGLDLIIKSIVRFEFEILVWNRQSVKVNKAARMAIDCAHRTEADVGIQPGDSHTISRPLLTKIVLVMLLLNTNTIISKDNPDYWYSRKLGRELKGVVNKRWYHVIWYAMCKLCYSERRSYSCLFFQPVDQSRIAMHAVPRSGYTFAEILERTAVPTHD